MRYRKKPVVIEAFQFFGKDFMDARNHLPDWPDWALDSISTCIPSSEQKVGSIWRDTQFHSGEFFCGTMEGPHQISEGDWIIQGVQGEIYPCKPDIFEATYEKA